MDVFHLRDTLISDYSDYVSSFIEIRDDRISNHVNEQLKEGVLWPEPLLQLNPTFKPGAWIDDLVSAETLHPTNSKIFRLKKGTDGERPMRLHRHQSDALLAAKSADNYVLTTGTGSGKSLSYIVPIVDHVLRRGSGKGVQAIIIYPMNALANSQMGELDKFLLNGFDGNPPVTYRRYTGQEKSDERDEIISNPPDIILTNYVMLELMMTRPRERQLIAAMRDLQFIVLDELHTYRGRQGADVAMLVRRVRNLCDNPKLQVVGTSATLAEGGTFTDQQVAIANVATQLFGATVKPERVIGETLQRATILREHNDAAFLATLRERVQRGEPAMEYETFVTDPLSSWVETTFGLTTEPETGRLKRAVPVSIEDAAAQLGEVLGISADLTTTAIRQTLLAGYQILTPTTNLPVFAFRLHQFISRGDTVYASLQHPANRYITLQKQRFVPHDRQRVLLPLSFCRECGQEYYTVTLTTDEKSGRSIYIPRELRDQSREEDKLRGFLYRNPKAAWHDDVDLLIEEGRIPDDWIEIYKDGLRVKYQHRRKLPQAVYIDTLGQENQQGDRYWFVKTPFNVCLNCGVNYSGRERSDFAKLATLSSEGRSTATTVLDLSALRTLKRDETLNRKAKKLLSFTDNRQDASLQAGHFNDFIEVGLLRSALLKAVEKAGSSGLSHDDLANKVFDALKLNYEQYARSGSGTGRLDRKRADSAFRDVLGYRLYQDQRRGWRITSPNLEQCGLLRIEYDMLSDICADSAVWQKCHAALVTATAEQREAVCKTFLDLLRRGMAVHVKYLDPIEQEKIKQNSGQRLAEPWAIDATEQMTHNFIAVPASRQSRDNREYLFVSDRSSFGMYLRRIGTFPNFEQQLKTVDSAEMIPQLFDILANEGLLEQVEDAPENGVAGYQLLADAMLWHADDGTQPHHDPLRMPALPTLSASATRTNQFFVNFYRHVAADLKDVYAREHTAQVPSNVREDRELAFRKADLPVLFCSPTMELGVDIDQLNAVNMRNVPPTPANYAQRSGRAGRSGQPALVFTYCTSGSPHDQYFFKRPQQMVAGAVRPPRLDLANQDLIRAHVHAVWLAETGQSLYDSLKELLNLEEDKLPVKEDVVSGLSQLNANQRAEKRVDEILLTISDYLEEATWYGDEWVRETLKQSIGRFDAAADRWRGLYRSALDQLNRQHDVISSPASATRAKNEATRLYQEAKRQLDLLLDVRSAAFSDFYSYRYFASEGFLPGYNFPRLPLSAFIPGRRGKKGDDSEYLSRPRFLAISEFGPRSVIYHEGSRYVINKAILPVEEDVFTTEAKVCGHCGYLHPISDIANPDNCDNCGTLLPSEMRSLFRMQNVSTQRRDRINSDEEERMRMGYELQTSVRFAEHNNRPSYSIATVNAADGRRLLQMTYGDAATIWRINKGWRRRKEPEILGFVLDVEKGYWQKNDQEIEADPEDPVGPHTQRVVPFVEDRRNCLLIEFDERYDREVMASLQPALKTAIQALYQLEDSELAAEPLPSAENRRLLLFYESAEGGAGILRQLVSNASAIRTVAREALSLCHFDPDTLQDLHRAPNSSEDCEAACYDCVMSYYNQPDHQLLDRHLVKTPLYELANASVAISPTSDERYAHLEHLKTQCESELERAWLDFLQARNLNLPDVAQRVIAACDTRTDFYYSERMVAVYIDGPDHDRAGMPARDAEIGDCLSEDLGVTVLRFRYDQRDQWETICANHSYVFGKVKA